MRPDERFFTMMRVALITLFAFTVVASAQDKKDDKAKAPVKGRVSGIVTAKGETWIEVKNEAEARPHRYIARWKDATDAAKIKDAPVGALVLLEWTLIDARPRVDAIAVAIDGGPGKKPELEKKSDSIAPPPRLKP